MSFSKGPATRSGPGIADATAASISSSSRVASWLWARSKDAEADGTKRLKRLSHLWRDDQNPLLDLR